MQVDFYLIKLIIKSLVNKNGLIMDNAITTFFNERKEAWLKKNLNASMTELEVKEKEVECYALFSLEQWLPNAAKRAGQISISTHPCTFSHPSARKNKNDYVSSIIAKSTQANDGFLRSGNVIVNADALGNAAALDVYKFLTLTLQDGKTLIQHIEQDTDTATKLLTLNANTSEHSYADLKKGFLTMTSSGSESITSSKIKQVYFPVDNNYHQLSILTPSGIVFKLRKKLDDMRFGDDIKAARECKKKNKEHKGFKEIYGLTTIGYGGTKPQNISVLNNQNGGKAHLLMSAPPSLKKRDLHFPIVDFFNQNFQYYYCKSQFYKLHTLYSQDINNMHVRANRDEYYQDIIDAIIKEMWLVRAVSNEQYNNKNSQLSKAQTIWLCEHKKDIRANEDEWLIEISKSITLFLFHGYEKLLKKKAFILGDAEFQQMQKIVSINKEALR